MSQWIGTLHGGSSHWQPEVDERIIRERLTQQDRVNRVGCWREMIAPSSSTCWIGGYLKMDDDRIVITKNSPHAW